MKHLASGAVFVVYLTTSESSAFVDRFQKFFVDLVEAFLSRLAEGDGLGDHQVQLLDVGAGRHWGRYSRLKMSGGYPATLGFTVR